MVGAAVIHLALLLWAAAFVLYIYYNGDYPSTALALVAGVLVTLWFGALVIGWRARRRHALLIWLLPLAWFAGYFPALQVGCSSCNWGQGAVVSQGYSGRYHIVAIRVQSTAQTVTVIDGEAWLPDLDGSMIWTYSGTRGHPGFAFSTAKNPFEVVSDGSSLWVTSAVGSITKFNATSLREVHREEVGGALYFLSVNGPSIWAVDADGDRVIKLDRQSGQLSKTIATGREPSGIVALEDAIWVTQYRDDEVVRIDAVTDEVVTRIPTGVGPGYVAAAFGSIWVSNECDCGAPNLTRIDPSTNKVVARIRVGATPIGIAQVGSELWVANIDSKTISVIDPATNTVSTTIHLPSGPYTLAAGADAVWVATYRQRELIRIDLSR